MSVDATKWAWRQDVAQADKLVLLAVADHAGEFGETWVGQKRLSEMCGVTDRAIRRGLASLAERGMLTRYRRHRRNGSRTSDLLVLPLPGVVPDLSQIEGLIGEKIDGDAIAPGRQLPGGHPEGNGTTTRTPASGPEPLVNPQECLSSGDRSAGEEWVGVTDDVREDAEELLRRKRKVDRQVVTDREMQVAAAALCEFNRQAEGTLGLGAHLVPLVMRIRERPRWDAAKHMRLVQSAWRIKWWEARGIRGRPKLAFVYGDRAFERVVQDAADEAAGRPPEEDWDVTTKRYSGNRAWDQLTPREQHNAREAVTMRIKPWLERDEAVPVTSNGRAITSFLD